MFYGYFGKRIWIESFTKNKCTKIIMQMVDTSFKFFLNAKNALRLLDILKSFIFKKTFYFHDPLLPVYIWRQSMDSLLKKINETDEREQSLYNMSFYLKVIL